jgi:hypothetical protein
MGAAIGTLVILRPTLVKPRARTLSWR